MKANRTGKDNPPPVIEDLKDGTFYYNFNVVHTKVEVEDGGEDDNWDYNQVRCNYPINIDAIQTEVDNQGYDHQVNIDNA